MATFLKTHHSIKLLNTHKFEVINQEMKQVITGSLASGSLNLSYSLKALAISTASRNLVTLHQAPGHPSLEYFAKCSQTNTFLNYNALRAPPAK
ncbi:hypothetical protein O181_045656 [Austropuccinia psidii MF-1]|uniref:Uncharacterized protein n=1 Tax=Austropuccinia psidii MF-1 TaxID=1389203 RepID=A0A9Q3DSP9_9BASI|nr:hypothetical protein [Austropuccinia psidii MF-1]